VYFDTGSSILIIFMAFADMTQDTVFSDFERDI
jgi:hypothetical protein